MSDCCSPSSPVASPLWTWTCSSCASEERWWWDTEETKREREDHIRQGQNDYNILCIKHLHTSFAFCSMADFFPQEKLSVDAGLGCDDVLQITERGERKLQTLQPCGCMEQ